MDARLKDARREIAEEIGADIANFTPPSEKRFTGVEVMLAVGGALLFGFLKGLAEKAGEKVGGKVGEKIGEPLADYIGRKIDELTGKDKESQEAALEEARTEARRQIEAAGLQPAALLEITETVEAEMVRTLAGQAPEEISIRITRKVSKAAIGTL